MESVKILLNNNFTGSTQIGASGLTFDNGYYSYVNSNGGGIVNEFNVRGYLNDSRNQKIINDFFTYLTGNTSPQETLNIVTSDKKLANVFNGYFQNFIVSASSNSNTAVIASNLTGTTAQTITEYFYPWIGQSENIQLSGIPESIVNTTLSSRTINFITETTTEESYYVPITLKNTNAQISRMTFEPCDPLINKTTQFLYPQYSAITSAYFANSTNSEPDTINSLVQCFVDLNLHTNENTNTTPELLSVSFESDFYFVDEGTTVQVKISLNQPSISGFEEATILLNPFGATLNSDFTPLETYPLTLSWVIGEQDKFLTFNVNSDFEEEVNEPFLLQIVGAINLNLGNVLNTTVYIKDKTVLNHVAIVRSLIPADNSGITHLVVDEADDTNFLVQLDHPAFGVEKVTLEQVSILSTTNGDIGPAAHPLAASEYIIQTTIPGQGPITITLPYIISFNAGEIDKYFSIFIKDNIKLEPDKTAFFQLSSQQFCNIDQSKKMLEVTALEDDGKYKYVHLNFGRIYNEFGNGTTNMLMRMLDPQPDSFGGSYNNIYISQYSHYLIEYGKTIRFKDYSNNNVQSVKFVTPYLKAKITNQGTTQALVNNIAINPGQSTTVVITGNEFIIAATTNANRNVTTDFYDDATYKIELIDSYDAHGEFSAVQMAPSIPNFNPFKLMDINNSSLATNNTINLGTFTISGYDVSNTDATYAYHLKSKYLDVNTARIDGSDFFGNPTISCPVVSSFFNNVSSSEFYKIKIEDISVFGIILLNHNSTRISNNNYSKYNGFEFVDYTQSANYTCNRTNSDYNGLDYVNLPFIIEP